MDTIISVLVGLAVFTVSYKLIPYRRLGVRKPSIALLPKYKTEVTLADSLVDAVALENKLALFGFRKSAREDGITYFVRGHVLGEFTIKLARIKLGVQIPREKKSEITLEASWVIAFDTGDCWTFLTELSEKLEKNIP